LFKFALSNLLRRKSRTFLSIFMIAVGVLSIIAMVSLVDGLFQEIQSATGSLEGIMVLGGEMGPLFSQIDEDYKNDIESVAGVKDVEPVVISMAQSIDGKSLQMEFMNMVRLIGTEFSNSADNSVSGVDGELVDGRSLKPGETGMVIIGTEIRENFSKFPGNNIKINGEKYKIVGVYKTGSAMQNSGIIMDIDDLRDLLAFPDNKVSAFSISLVNPSDIDRVAKLLEFKLPEELNIMNTAQFAESLASVLGNVRLMVFAVAAIAAIVAGVGIINTMLMSVMERFKEIGALKATGWTNSNVMRMILSESLLIGIIGGVSGVILGLILTMLLAPMTGFAMHVSIELMIETFVFAVGIGVFAGLYPAWKASTFNPIEALHME